MLRRATLCNAIIENINSQANAESRLEAVEQAHEFAKAVVENLQEHAHVQISDVVSRVLRTCFDYDFRVVFEQKRNQTETRLVFVKDEIEHDPMSMSGGGAVDVAAFGLRLAGLLLAVKPRRKLLILDEPFKFLSARDRLARENLPRVRSILERLCEELGLQLIIVTHVPELQLGKVIEFD